MKKEQLMKPIMSFWSEPYIRGFYNRWLNDSSWNLSWMLSVECCSKIYGKPHLYTDDAGKHFLVDQLGLDFDSVDLSLNDLNGNNPKFASLGRTFAVGMQTEPFIHIDYDFLLFEKIPEELVKNGVLLERCKYITLEKDKRPDNPPCCPEYLEKANLLPEWWNSFKKKKEYNYAQLGIMGGSNIEYFRKFSQTVFDIINSNPSEYWDGFFKPPFPFSPQYTIDQYTAHSIARETNINPSYAIEMDGTQNFSHAHAGFDKLSRELFGRFSIRLIRDHPSLIPKAKEFAGLRISEVPKVSVIIIPNEYGTTYDSLLRVFIPRRVAPDEIIVSEYKLSESDKNFISKIDGIKIIAGGSSYMESLRKAFKRGSGQVIIVIDGHVKAPKNYIENSIAAFTEHPNTVFCTASKDFSDEKIKECIGGLQDDYGIRPNLIDCNLIRRTMSVQTLYGGLYVFPYSALHDVFESKFQTESISGMSAFFQSKGIECRCITGIEASNNFKTESSKIFV
jgi:hypothetical protein